MQPLDTIDRLIEAARQGYDWSQDATAQKTAAACMRDVWAALSLSDAQASDTVTANCLTFLGGCRQYWDKGDRIPDAFLARLDRFLTQVDPTDDAATLICRLLESVGTVAIKAGQQMCEHPDVPKRFRAPLEKMRDHNTELSRIGMWKTLSSAYLPSETTAQGLNAIAAAMRGYGSGPTCASKLAGLGKVLGTGSVKQAAWSEVNGQRVVAAVLCDASAGDMRGTVSALQSLEETRNIIKRLEPMLKREFDLELEAKAFDALRETQVGRADVVSVPKVLFAARTAIIRAPALGLPVSEILREQTLDDGQLARLTQVHRLLVRSALDTEPSWLGSWAMAPINSRA